MVLPDVEKLAQRLAEDAYRIAAATRRADLRHVESDLSGAARMELAAAIRLWMAELSALLAEAGDAFGDGDDDDAEPQKPEQLIVDVAAMGAISLAESRRLMDLVDGETDHWECIDRCDVALRDIVSTATAVENALSAYTGNPALLVADDELDKALRIRHLYEKFRRAIRDHVTAEEKPVARRIHSAGTALAMLVGHSEYPLMRVGDRILVRKLQHRVLEWSTSPNEPDGVHLCTELLSVAELLMAINSRAEIVDYDRKRNGSAALAEELSTPMREGD